MSVPVVALVADPELLDGIPDAWARRYPERADDVVFRVPGDASEESLADAGSDAEILFGCRTPIGAGLLDRLPATRYVQQCSAGIDNVDVREIERRGILLARVEGSGVTAVAEHTLMLILGLARRLCEANAATHAGSWIWPQLYDDIWELRGKRVGLVGFGAIGREVGRLVAAFGAEVVYTRQREARAEVPFAAERVDAGELFASSRVVSLHCPLTDATRRLVDADVLQAMRPDALLVNTARGAIVDEHALAEALRAGSIAGAAVDTYGSHSDPIAADSPLKGAPNLLLTPHSAGCTRENLDYTFHEAGLANLAAWLDGRSLRGIVVAPRQPES